MKHISKILAKFSPWWIMKVYFCVKMSWFKAPALVHICLAHNIACEYETGQKWTSIYKVCRRSIERAACTRASLFNWETIDTLFASTMHILMTLKYWKLSISIVNAQCTIDMAVWHQWHYWFPLHVCLQLKYVICMHIAHCYCLYSLRV